jgi:hypothetical protein
VWDMYYEELKKWQEQQKAEKVVESKAD